MRMYEWARREIEIAKNIERVDNQEDEWDYGCACYDSALKAFKSLCEDNHSGMSIAFTKNILNRLIDGKCLTPIEDTSDVWEYSYTKDLDGTKVYQNNRMSSLFKEIDKDNNIKYTDNDYVICTDVKNNTCWHDFKANNLVYEKYPITMPYLPHNKPYKVYTEDFYYLHPNAIGEFDHKAYLYMITPEGKQENIDRYFTETKDGFIEISKEQYMQRKEETFNEKH